MALGWIDEGIQSLLPNRVYDMRDVGVNAIAALMTIVGSMTLQWVCKRIGRSPQQDEPLDLGD